MDTRTETKKELPSWLKSKWLWTIVGAFIFLIIIGSMTYSAGYDNGKTSEKAKIDKKIVSYNQLVDQINQKEDETREIESKIVTLNNEFSSKSQEFDAAQKVADQADDIKKQISESETKLSSLQSNIKSKEEELDSKQKELASVSGQIIKAKTAPKTLQAGVYTVGKDIPSGRYKATPVGGGSNFVTFDTSGIPDVNTILGSNGEPSYTFEIIDGYKIQTEATVKLTPIE